MTTKITLDIETFNTPSLKRMAYALLEGGPEMLRHGERREAFMAVRQCIAELSSRANQGDISELIEMHDTWLKRANPLKPALKRKPA